MTTLSILIVIKNEEKQIEKCLKTVCFADEIIVVLDNCTDKSEEIVSKYTKKFYLGNWNLEGERRNFGLQKCTKDWILEIDADGRVPNVLKKEINKVIRHSNYDWHKIGVNNFLSDKIINHGWGAYFGKSAYAGLFRKNKKVWGNQRVHPEINLSGKEGKALQNKINHFYCKNIFDLFVKLDSYSTARAYDLANSNKEETLMRNVRRIFSRFWKCFFLRKGFKEREIGFTIAMVAAIYPLISYLKYKNTSND